MDSNSELVKAIRVILENGDRLTEDAQNLWEIERFPSAFALCILAQEEYAESQPAERATAFTVNLGCRPLPRAAVFRSAVPGVPLRSTPGSMLPPAAAG